MAIPMRYRQHLMDACGGQMVITIDNNDRCLLLYPLQEWETLERKLQKLSSMNRQSRRAKRLLIGHATDVEMDGSGRLLVPPLLREFAELEKRTVLIGQSNKFELWSETLWNESRDEWLAEGDDFSDLPEEMETLSL
jgi:transcriptional regulator MraZ